MLRMSAWRGISLIFLMTGLVGAQEERALSDSTVFRLFIEQGNFGHAEKRCFNEGNDTFSFTLARIDSEDEFNFIIEAFNLETLELPVVNDNQNNPRRTIWIGLKRFPETDVETRSTKNLSFVDGIETGRTFFETFGSLPWASTQPNNVDEGQHCVSWETKLEKGTDLPLRWYDDDCSLRIPAFLCRGEIIPTALPTLSPTPAPSDSPTLKPTDSPSLSPTLKPTDSPSLSPTLKPTDSPSSAPTLEPTDSPSSSPTLEPTDAPQAAEAAAPPDDDNSLVNTIFLSVAGISGMLMLLSLLIILREKRDLKVLRQALNDIELKETLSELGKAAETGGPSFRL